MSQWGFLFAVTGASAGLAVGWLVPRKHEASARLELELKARHRMREEAGLVAREAAIAFRQRRGEHERERASQRLAELESMILKQELRVKTMWDLFHESQSRRPYPMRRRPDPERAAGQHADTFAACLEIARELIWNERRIRAIGRLREGPGWVNPYDLAFPECEGLLPTYLDGMHALSALERKRSDLRIWGAADDSQPAREADDQIARQREHNEELCAELGELLGPRRVGLVAESERLGAALARRAAAHPEWLDLAVEVKRMQEHSGDWFDRLIAEDDTLAQLRSRAEGERIRLALPVNPIMVEPGVQTSARPVHPDPARWLVLGGLGGWVAGMLAAVPWQRKGRPTAAGPECGEEAATASLAPPPQK